MKKRIVALIGALSLTFAMSLNVFAAGSVTSSSVDAAVKDIPEVAVKDDKVVVTVGEISAEININEDELYAASIHLTGAYYEANGFGRLPVNASPIKRVDDVVNVAKAVAKEIAVPSVFTDKAIKGIVNNKIIAVELNPAYDVDKSKPVVVTFDVETMGLSKPAEGEEFLAIDAKDGGIKTFVGEYKDGKVTFSFDTFSPYAILMVRTESIGQSQPPYNPDWDPAVQAERKAAAQSQEVALAAYLASGGAIPVAAIAPKTGDVAALVSIMAVIFLGGAVTAVAMSRKRA